MDSDPDANQIMFQLLFLVFLTLVNAYFAGAEMAVVSVNRNRIKRLSDDGDKRASLILSLLNDSTKFLSTIQVAITLAGFFSSASAATGISQVLGGWMKVRNIPYAQEVAMVVVTILLSFFTLIFGELVPKRIALQKAEKFSLWTVKPIYFISRVMSPFIKLLSVTTNLILKLFGMNGASMEEAVSEEEIKALLVTGSETGIFKEREMEMINSIFSFDDKMARDVMVVRKDVYAIDINEPLTDYLDEMIDSNHTKIPVYREEVDNIVGILHMVDFMKAAREVGFEQVSVSAIMREPYFVPETKSTDALFQELQIKADQMAVLIDEFGGFSGIVTIEDLIEEIMGDINSEYDIVEPELEQIDDNIYRIDGGMELDDLNHKLTLKLHTDHYDTVSGYLIEQIGYIPKDGECPHFQIENLLFQVQEARDRRIQKVLVTIQ